MEIGGTGNRDSSTAAAIGDGIGVLVDSTATNTQIESSVTSAVTDGIKVNGASGVRIFDSVLTSSGNAGIEVDNGSNVQLVDDTFQSNCAGVLVDGTAAGVVVNDDARRLTGCVGTGCP